MTARMPLIGLAILEFVLWFPLLLIAGSYALPADWVPVWLVSMPLAFLAGRFISGFWRAIGLRWYWLLWALLLMVSIYLRLNWMIALMLTLDVAMIWRGISVERWNSGKWAAITAVYLLTASVFHKQLSLPLEIILQIVGAGALIAFLFALNRVLLQTAAYHPGLLSGKTLRLNRRWIGMLAGGTLLLAIIEALWLGPYIGWFQRLFDISFNQVGASMQAPLKLPDNLMPKPKSNAAPAPAVPTKDPWWITAVMQFFQFVAHEWLYILIGGIVLVVLLRLRGVRKAIAAWRKALIQLLRGREEEETPYKDEQHAILRPQALRRKEAARRPHPRPEPVDWQRLNGREKTRVLFRYFLASVSPGKGALPRHMTPGELWREMRGLAGREDSGSAARTWREAERIGFLNLYERVRFGLEDPSGETLQELDELWRIRSE